MAKAKQPNIEFEGKCFEFLIYFGDALIFGCGLERLIVESDGSFYGTYRMDDRKGVNLIF